MDKAKKLSGAKHRRRKREREMTCRGDATAVKYVDGERVRVR